MSNWLLQFAFSALTILACDVQYGPMLGGTFAITFAMTFANFLIWWGRPMSAFGLFSDIPEEHQGKVRIPDVCNAEGIRCIRLADLIEEEDWKF